MNIGAKMPRCQDAKLFFVGSVGKNVSPYFYKYPRTSESRVSQYTLISFTSPTQLNSAISQPIADAITDNRDCRPPLLKFLRQPMVEAQ